MKRLLFLVMVCCVAFASGAQLLWRISGNGLSRSSYLFGTHHLAPVSVADSVRSLSAVFSSVGQICGELDMEELTASGQMQSVADAMLLPEDTLLSDLLTPSQLERTDSVVRKYMGIGLSVSGLMRLKPAALLAQLSAEICRRQIPNSDSDGVLDLYLQQWGKEVAGKTCRGLESVAFQLGLLYGSPLPRQAEQLLCLIEHEDWMTDVSKRLFAAYMRRDLDAVGRIMGERMNSVCDSTPEEEEALIAGRNEAWVGEMEDMMREVSTLFVVGVGHLVGEKGLLPLLREAGYLVEPMG